MKALKIITITLLVFGVFYVTAITALWAVILLPYWFWIVLGGFLIVTGLIWACDCIWRIE